MKRTSVRNTRRVAVYAAVVAAVALVLSTIVPVNRDSVYFCEITGSMKLQTTWLGLVSCTSYDASPLEKFIQSQFPGELRHKWVWHGASENNLFGRALRLEDSFRQTCFLGEFVRSAVFGRLSPADKRRFYDILEWSSNALSAEEKRRMYSELINLGGDDALREFISNRAIGIRVRVAQ